MNYIYHVYKPLNTLNPGDSYFTNDVSFHQNGLKNRDNIRFVVGVQQHDGFKQLLIMRNENKMITFIRVNSHDEDPYEVLTLNDI